MRILREPLDGNAAAPALVVLLPGAYGGAEDFRTQGFVAAVRARGLAADIALADTHFGHFTDHSVIRRLRDDIVLSGRRAGHRHVWLAGISLGALAALGYAARHGDEIAGVLAIAPYPGSRDILREIAAAGGPARWRAHSEAVDDDLEREVWRWLADPVRTAGAIYMGYGREDRFADGQRLLADTLPPSHVQAVPGTHDWPAWRAIWDAWLARGLLPTLEDR